MKTLAYFSLFMVLVSAMPAAPVYAGPVIPLTSSETEDYHPSSREEKIHKLEDELKQITKQLKQIRKDLKALD